MNKPITQLARLALATALILPGFVNAQNYGVRINGTMQAYAGILNDSATFGTGTQNGVASASASDSVSSEGLDQGSAQYGRAAVSASANAAMGTLGASASLSASSTPQLTFSSNGYFNRAEVGFSLSTFDDIVLQSSTLSFVTVHFTLSLNSQVSETGDIALGSGNVLARLNFDEGGPNLGLWAENNSESGSSGVFSQDIQLQIGRHYGLSHYMSVGAIGEASLTQGGLTFFQTWTMDISADHTSHAFIDVLGDATLTSASGHDYTTTSLAAVPEPETYAMLLAGLCVVGFVARRGFCFWQLDAM
jgi:hypothetical protein